MSALRKTDSQTISHTPKASESVAVSSKQNRRSHFRMDVKLGFGFKILSPQEAETTLLPRGQDIYDVIDYFGSDLCKMNEEFLQLLTQIKIKSKPLGIMFEILNNKVNMLFSSMDQKDVGLVLPRRKVNLSGNGLGFTTARPAEVGDVVDLMFKLNREDALILIRSKVVRVIGGEPNYLGLHFEDIHPVDKRRIISYLFDKQVLEPH